MEIDSAPPPDHQISEHSYTHEPVSEPHPDSPSRVGPIQRSSGPSTITQISYQDPPNTPKTSRRCRVRAEELNSPEHVRRRMSMQLPILHHAYHPVIGGMATSRSSLLGSPDTATPLAPTQCTCTVPPVDSQV
ncbi:Gamma-aminobutyric acid type B receptor subunit 2 [Merluccius polli]|uniref:Gamma-aminobutyric acid type B receptor subunit 2 n=1 Tax=Merluccius polli TaxID=89951 RepID=A0AA47MZL1_MERPO|nr:Gamma-aminobutyric acid type B receptor subunit 2 [Merluccius polli]